jgi:hypothetical protein
MFLFKCDHIIYSVTVFSLSGFNSVNHYFRSSKRQFKYGDLRQIIVYVGQNVW